MPTERPFIGFLTDFGLDGAAAICRGVMLGICPEAEIIDVSHVVPKYRIAAGSFVLRMALPYLPMGTHVAIVDPGVGTTRRPIAVRVERGDVLVGPDNGLLPGPAEALGGVAEVRELRNRELWLPQTSSTFHGRDVFAPVAAHLAAGDTTFEEVGPVLPPDGLVRLPEPAASVADGALQTEIVYIDSFGNLRLAGTRRDLEALGWPLPGARVAASISGRTWPATAALTFGAVGIGETVLYVDSSGNLALGDNQGNLAARTAASVGGPVVVELLGGSA